MTHVTVRCSTRQDIGWGSVNVSSLPSNQQSPHVSGLETTKGGMPSNCKQLTDRKCPEIGRPSANARAWMDEDQSTEQIHVFAVYSANAVLN